MKKIILLTAFVALLVGCSTTSLVVGNTRPPTDPEKLKVYLKPPASYEEIAVIGADDMGVFAFTGQQRLDATLKRAKKRAAELGANGLLVTDIRSNSGSSVTVGTGVVNSPNGPTVGVVTGTTSPTTTKNVSAIAIWVTKE